MFIGKGISISTGFDLNSQSPLDNRTIFKTIEERDSLPSINIYEGLECFIEDTKVKYQYLNGQWKEIEIWDNVTVAKEDSTNKLKLSFYSNTVLKKEVEIDVPSVSIGDIDIWDDATVTKDIVNNRNEISFYSKGVLKKTIYIDGLGGLTDELITDISNMKNTIEVLTNEINLLKERVAYLEQNQGTTPMSYTIITRDGDTIVTKDGDAIVTK